jgi:D-alanyl-D-alanine carboxypeptidase (penicillin-binding protein 5/6)
VEDLSTGEVLFAKRPRLHRPIASIAKLMTAMLVIEREPLDREVVVSALATRQEPTVIGLRPGERITIASLLYGLLLASGNDAAVALAESVSGRVRAFVRLMNARARSLGLTDTRFASASGLNDQGYSTVRDVATLTRWALASPLIASIVATRRHTISGPKGRPQRLRNLNRMLAGYRGAVGVKTGYTRAAGNCVVAAARLGVHSVLSVALGDDPRTVWRDAYSDSRILLDYGFRRLDASSQSGSAI